MLTFISTDSGCILELANSKNRLLPDLTRGEFLEWLGLMRAKKVSALHFIQKHQILPTVIDTVEAERSNIEKVSAIRRKFENFLWIGSYCRFRYKKKTFTM